MSTQVNQACCTVPPVTTDDYTPKGKYEPYAGIDKAYFTGDKTSKKAIVVVYDIFGYFPQTIQGSDILAETVGARVVMPDIFKGKPYPLDMYPPDNEEKKALFGEFFATSAKFEDRVQDAINVAAKLREEGAEKVGLIGYCWGGKVAAITGASGKFDAVATCHPAFLDATDVPKLKCPMAFFPTNDGPAHLEACKAYEEGLKANPLNDYKLYETQEHGFAAARADLKNPENLKEYKDVYGRLGSFFSKALA